MRLLPHQIAIRIVEGTLPHDVEPDPHVLFDGKDGALAYLRDLTEEDFGYDAAVWESWFERCPPEMLRLYEDEYMRKAMARQSSGG